MGHHPERPVAADRLDGWHLHAQPGHRSRSRGGLLRGAVAAAADLRSRRLDRLHLRPVQRQPDRRGSQHSDLAGRPGADPGHRRQHHQAHAQLGPAGRRTLRRRLDRLHPGAVVGIPRPERLRGHDHDHVRPRWPARDRPHPRPGLPALRARHAHRGRHDPPGGRRPDPGRQVDARPALADQLPLLADGSAPRCLLPRDALPRLGAGPDGLALQPPGRRVHDVLLGLRFRPAALRARHDGAGVHLHLRSRSRPR